MFLVMIHLLIVQIPQVVGGLECTGFRFYRSRLLQILEGFRVQIHIPLHQRVLQNQSVQVREWLR